MTLSVPVKKTNKFKWDDKEIERMEKNHLRPLIAPVNHNTLDNSKTLNIVHTLMGNFCHGNKDKISHMEDMGNDATMLIGYHDKVCFTIKFFNL